MPSEKSNDNFCSSFTKIMESLYAPVNGRRLVLNRQTIVGMDFDLHRCVTDHATGSSEVTLQKTETLVDRSAYSSPFEPVDVGYVARVKTTSKITIPPGSQIQPSTFSSASMSKGIHGPRLDILSSNAVFEQNREELERVTTVSPGYKF